MDHGVCAALAELADDPTRSEEPCEGRLSRTATRLRFHYRSLWFGEQLFLAGLIPSEGGVADALDNALAETTSVLYQAEAVRDDLSLGTGPLDLLADLEQITSA